MCLRSHSGLSANCCLIYSSVFQLIIFLHTSFLLVEFRLGSPNHCSCYVKCLFKKHFSFTSSLSLSGTDSWAVGVTLGSPWEQGHLSHSSWQNQEQREGGRRRSEEGNHITSKPSGGSARKCRWRANCVVSLWGVAVLAEGGPRPLGATRSGWQTHQVTTAERGSLCPHLWEAPGPLLVKSDPWCYSKTHVMEMDRF